MKMIILKRNDGWITILSPNQKARLKYESENDWLERIAIKDGSGLSFEIVDSSDIPYSEGDRDCWKFDETDKKVKVCPIKKAAKEALKAKKELAKTALKNKLKLSDDELLLLRSIL